MAAAAALAVRGRPLSRPNPSVGAIIVRDGKVLSRGWTQPGGRPHAEAVAIGMTGSDALAGATLYVTLEPCAHVSDRGPACADLVAQSRLARAVIGCSDPDPRTAGMGIARIADAGIRVDLIDSPQAQSSLSGYLSQRRRGRPEVTLKLATSLDGCIGLASGESKWITGEPARHHAHAVRAQCDGIVVGGGTLRTDAPRLDVRLPGLDARRPDRFVLTTGTVPGGWTGLASPEAIHDLTDVQYLIVEGGAQAAAAFLAADLVDRLMIYRAPVIIGGGLPGIADIGLTALADAHGRWRIEDRRQLGSDILEVYSRTPSPIFDPSQTFDRA